jgi:hypothetical protein
MDFDMHSGNSKSLIVSVLDKPNGSAVSLVSAQAIKWQLFHSTPATADPIISKSLTSGITINTPASAGIFTVVISSTDTAGLSGLYYHETEVTDAAGNKETVDSGFINIKLKRIA